MGDAERDTNLLDEVLEPTEAPCYPDASRPDLFGAESDDEEGQPYAETQQVDTAETQLFEDQPFETQVPEIDLTAEQPEQLQAQSLPEGEALDVREGVQPDEVFVDEEPEQADYDDAQPPVGSEALEGKAEKGPLDDIFASDSEDEGAQPARAGGHLSEAEEEDEEDEFEAMFKTGKKRKKPGRTHEMVEVVEALIANMEVAAEMDISANEEGKPAVNKIKLLPEVESKLSQAVLHKELLDGGILGAMKLWIELLPDGSLPNVKVRTAILKLLQKLPLDLSLDGRKEQLRKSELGKYIMFYSKLPDEILTNRQLARGLVEKWSRPIFEQFRESAADDELQDETLSATYSTYTVLKRKEDLLNGLSVAQERERELAVMRKRRKKELEASEPNPIAVRNLKPGDPGFRWHASIPAPAKLDYMRRPDSMAATEGEAVKGKAKPKDKMSKKLAAMSKKGARKGAGEGKISLQGRGLLL